MASSLVDRTSTGAASVMVPTWCPAVKRHCRAPPPPRSGPTRVVRPISQIVHVPAMAIALPGRAMACTVNAFTPSSNARIPVHLRQRA
ncbi:uncharacterized protein CMC5_051490 [Chondromyces crocatus]|uniref:Uncharacterized protein n=1 Tax=Chondromyces crocatus TaxID=52 RepID=A0A0K1EJX6_CHOCO|nr:uncharacterized protein CMC5_051490 [Chondromyces crocatus]